MQKKKSTQKSVESFSEFAYIFAVLEKNNVVFMDEISNTLKRQIFQSRFFRIAFDSFSKSMNFGWNDKRAKITFLEQQIWTEETHFEPL